MKVPDKNAEIDSLLERGVRENESFPLVNMALKVLADGEQHAWEVALAFIRRIAPDAEDTGELVTWWGDLARKGEAEGHIVIGLLCMTGLAEDPDGMTATKRFDLARALGWDVRDAPSST